MPKKQSTKFVLEVNNQTSQKFTHKEILNIFKRTIELAALDCLHGKKLELSVAIVAEAEVEKLNAQYRAKKAPTDVLSFCEYEKTADLNEHEEESLFLGELILCPEIIKKNALEDSETLAYAFSYIVAHGVLHLLGFAHGKKMFALQKLVAQQLVKC